MISECLFSEDRVYRYWLKRSWGPGKLINFCMLNPSTADEKRNDPTVERCEQRARRLGFEGYIVTNLFAYRATNPKVLLEFTGDAVGPFNDVHIREAAERAAIVICAWGNDGAHGGRDAAVLQILSAHKSKLHYLHINVATGQPAHPLYLSYSMQPKRLCA